MGVVLAIVFALKFTTEIDAYWTAQLDYHNYSVYQLAKWSDPKAGDIVVFYSPFDGTRLVKRVIGVPGDKIELRNNVLYINDKVAAYGKLELEISSAMRKDELPQSIFLREKLDGLDHPVRKLKDPRDGREISPPYSSYGPVKVPDGHYFMMGDNRDESKDSRFPPDNPDSRLSGPGMVPRQNIVGRASRIAVSVDPSNYYMPRWSRIFQALP